MRNLTLATCVAIAVSVFVMPANASALYNFSINLSSGITGTVTGTLDLPFINAGGSGTGAADSLVLTSVPAGFGAFVSNTVTSWADQENNSFTVSAGVITSVLFWALTNGTSTANELCLNSTGSPTGMFGEYSCPSGLNLLQSDVSTDGFNFNGLAGITFTPASTATPEPGTNGMILLGIASLCLAARRYNKGIGAHRSSGYRDSSLPISQ
jgi:hypothetical protein